MDEKTGLELANEAKRELDAIIKSQDGNGIFYRITQVRDLLGVALAELTDEQQSREALKANA